MNQRWAEFVRLGDLAAEPIEEAWGIGVLATAVERHGVWGFDRYGRYRFFAPPQPGVNPKATGDDASHVLDLLAQEHRRQIQEVDEEYWQIKGRLAEPSPLIPDPWLMQFGWMRDQLPDFAAIAAEQDPNTPEQLPAPTDSQASHKKEGYRRRLIGALLHIMAGEPDDGGLAPHPMWETPGDPDAFNRVALYIEKRWEGRAGRSRAIRDHFKDALRVLDLPPGQRPGIADQLPDSD